MTDIALAPHLTKQGDCSDCNVMALPVADGEMKVCPRCYAMLWHRDWSDDASRAAAARSAELTAQRLHLKAERKRQWEERKALADEERRLHKP